MARRLVVILAILAVVLAVTGYLLTLEGNALAQNVDARYQAWSKGCPAPSYGPCPNGTFPGAGQGDQIEQYMELGAIALVGAWVLGLAAIAVLVVGRRKRPRQV
ncbi:MAG: hypothetical protein L3K18_07640 [Thermoplasmata archaeon]|nr:hypothetical protein [Thermoplasmata archaeon]